MKKFYLCLSSALAFTFPQPTEACTRAVYLGIDSTVMTGRTMDWAEDIKTNLYVFPRGMNRDGGAGRDPLKWVSKYGSLIGTAYDVGTVDGINEKGLVANVLYLAESEYGNEGTEKPTLSIGAWAQYVLDRFATVDEAVEVLKEDSLQIIAPLLPNGAAATGHLALSDPSGDSAIFEYIKGKLVVHHGKEFKVMTNSPSYDQQLTLNSYWQTIGGLVMLPGTNRAADRFVRASFYVNAIPNNFEKEKALAGLMSVMCNVSVPLGLSTPGQPNIASTLWRSLSDQKNLVYYYASTQSPYIFWAPLNELDFKENASVKKLTLTSGEIYSGNVVKEFKNAEPFTFLK